MNITRILNLPEDFKKKLREIEFISLDEQSNGEYIILDNRVKGRIAIFFNKNWLAQVLQDKITKEYFFWTDGSIDYLSIEDMIKLLILIRDNTTNIFEGKKK